MKIMDKFSIEKNIKLYRTIQNIINPNFINNEKYIDEYLDGVKVRVFDLNKSTKIIIYIHGGGFVSGSIDTYSNICYHLASTTKCKVISIAYRLAPEYPYPCGLNDCYKVVSNIMEYKNWEDITIMGDSAGANLAFAVSLKGLHKRSFRASRLVLIYPTTQTDYSLDTKFKSVILNDGKGFLTRKNLEDYIKMYLPKKNYDCQYVNLLKAKHLFGLPKTLIITGSDDPLCDEGLALAKRLKRHLVSVKYHNLNGATHGYFTNILDTKYTNLTIELIKGFIGD